MTRNTTRKIDATDAQLLALLQRDALKPARVLAQTLHISVSSVQRRIRELRQRGVMRDTTGVIHCYHVTGDHTFVMIAALPSMDAFSKFAARVFESSRAVSKFRTSVVMNRVKTCGPLPVAAG